MATISPITPSVITDVVYSQSGAYNNPGSLMNYALLNDGSADGASGGAATGNDTGAFLKVDLKYPKYVSAVTLGGDYHNNVPGGFGLSCFRGTLQGSNDNSTWTDIYTLNSANLVNGLVTVTVNAFYQYLRVYYSNSYIALTEFSVSGGSVEFNPTFLLTVDGRTNPIKGQISSTTTASLTSDVVSSRTTMNRVVTTFSQLRTYSGNIAATYASMNNNTASWTTGSGTAVYDDGWVMADCGSPYFVSEVVYGYDYLSQVPGGWSAGYSTGVSIQASLDGATWTTAATVPDYTTTGSTNGLVRIGVNAKCRYLRLKHTSYFPVTEFSLWGTPISGFFAMF